MEEDLIIGNENDKNYLFYAVSAVGVDSEENIYVVDSRNFRVQKFDRYGKYLKTIGRKGQGPGEFEMPTNILIDEQTGELFIVDKMRRLKRFDSEGEYLDKDIHVNAQLLDSYIDDENCIWGKFALIGFRSLRRFNFEGNILNEVAEFPYKLQSKIQSKRAVGTSLRIQGSFYTHGYEYDLYLAKIDGQTLVYGYSDRYEMEIIGLDATTKMRISKQEQPQGFTSIEKDRIKFNIQSSSTARGQPTGDITLEFPEHKPFFYGIFCDDLGRIYVRKTPAAGEDHDTFEYDVFSSAGYYLYRGKLNCHPQMIKSGFLYVISKDEDTGLETVTRFKITNWNQLKTGTS